MLAAIRDASVGEGQRIRGAIPAIQGGRLYFDLARVAHFEWDGAYGGSEARFGWNIGNRLNRFWLADLEDFDESPVRVVNRSYFEGSSVVQVRRLLEDLRGLEDQDAACRRKRFLRVETDRLVEAFEGIAVSAGSPSGAGLHVYRADRHVATIACRAAVTEAGRDAGGATEARGLHDGLEVAQLPPLNSQGEVQVPGDVDGLLGYLRDRGLDDLADDLEYKRLLIEEDPDELPVCDESVRGFARFIATEQLVGAPTLTVDVAGHIGLEWVIPDQLTSRSGGQMAGTGQDDNQVWGKGDGVLGMWFLPSGMVRVYGTSGPVGQGIDRMRVNDTLPPGRVVITVEPFLSRLEV